ncbi:hypothetical protein SDC9_46017 [bioreactor metagenome]|uniref:Uncharacterized protein n=1 Tax=bioreactor metagenome TaxID=1076179 RepID=A0A644W8H4_9ZZZZ
MKYEPRIYRNDLSEGRFHYFNVTEEESDLQIGVGAKEYNDRIHKRTSEMVKSLRDQLKNYILQHPDFLNSHRPVEVDDLAPEIAGLMIKHSVAANVGPMAAVAGAFAELIGTQLCKEFDLKELIVENGGDLWIKAMKPVTVRIDAGPSSLSGLIGIEIQQEQTPCGICTSSGSTGHSFSYGKADAVTVVSEFASAADAWATSMCNRIHAKEDLRKEVTLSQRISGITGVVAIMQEAVAVSGNITIKKV